MENPCQLAFQRGEEPKGFFPARNSCLPETLNQFEKISRKLSKKKVFCFLFLPMGKERVAFSSSYKTLHFLNWKLDVLLVSVLQISLHFILSPCSPASGRADLIFLFHKGGWWCFAGLGKQLAPGAPLEHPLLHNCLLTAGIWGLAPIDCTQPRCSQK